MERTLIRAGTIVTMDSRRSIIRRDGILLEGDHIDHILTEPEMQAMKQFDGEIVDAGRLVAIPGFIQTHLHLCQTLFRGLADDLSLLDWLRLKIFPFEAAHDARSMYASAMVGIAELIRSGTTTILDMGSVHHEEEVVRALDETGLRAFVGKAMMDVNTIFPKLMEPTAQALSTTRHQAGQWHGSSGGRIRYAVAPRFVLSCSNRLLREAYEMTRASPGMLFHTHAAENRSEMDAVRKRCGMDNIEFFESIGVLQANTCLAHCIWVNDREVGLIRDRKTKVLHCPSSNLKLGSGIARVPELLSHGIQVSLGADGAPCNNTLNMFEEMRLAALIQKPAHGAQALPAQTVFEMATLGGAIALGIERETGSIEQGKKADIVLLDIEQAWNPYETADVYSSIVYTGSAENVHSVLVDGKWLYRNGQHTLIDQSRTVNDARNELRRLLQRVDN